jgi:hypothetical protein
MVSFRENSWKMKLDISKEKDIRSTSTSSGSTEYYRRDNLSNALDIILDLRDQKNVWFDPLMDRAGYQRF